jgi:hypothetical protein
MPPSARSDRYSALCRTYKNEALLYEVSEPFRLHVHLWFPRRQPGTLIGLKRQYRLALMEDRHERITKAPGDSKLHDLSRFLASEARHRENSQALHFFKVDAL